MNNFTRNGFLIAQAKKALLGCNLTENLLLININYEYTIFNPLNKLTFSSNVLNLFKNYIIGLTQSSLSPAVAFWIGIKLSNLND